MYLSKLKNRRGSIVPAAAIVVAMGSSAIAADLAGSEKVLEPVFDPARFKSAPTRDWSLIVGAGARYKPEYEGSDDFEISPIPLVRFTYGQWLEIDPRGVAVTPFRHGGFSLSGTVGYETGRDEDDNQMLRGLGDIDFAATIGLRAAYEWGPVELYAAVHQTIDGSESLIGHFGIGYSTAVTERLILGAKVEAIVANDKHMEAYFGVNSVQSAASGLPQYTAEAGLKRVDFSASATYFMNENWFVRGEGGVGILTGDAADSPIVKEELQPSVSLSIGYKF